MNRSWIKSLVEDTKIKLNNRLCAEKMPLIDVTSVPQHTCCPQDHEVDVLPVSPQFWQPWVKEDSVAVVAAIALQPNENEITTCQLDRRDI